MEEGYRQHQHRQHQQSSSSMAPPEVGDRTPYSRSGGGGGKLKITKGSSRGRIPSGATPYDRPAAAARHNLPPPAAAATVAPLGQEKKGWIGRGIVDSASRILTNGATFLFTSIFKRQAPAITAPPIPEPSIDGIGDDVPCLELAPPSNSHDEQVTSDDCNDAIARFENGPCDPTIDRYGRRDPVDDAVDIENILREKELTSEQCERYIKLIRSRFHVEDDQSKPSPLPPASRAQRWTPIQVPIRGSRELLKKRDTAETSSPISPSMSFRGPSILPGASTKRKPYSEAMDLTCFRKAKQQTGFKLSAPVQSTRTAGKILDALESSPSPFKDLEPRPAPEPPRRRAEMPASATTPAAEKTPGFKSKRGNLAPIGKPSASASSSFTFHVSSARSGPEPPTPKIPSPPSIVPSRDYYSKANGSATEIVNDFAARVEKASSILDGNFGSSLTSFPTPSGFDPGSSSSRLVAGSDDDDKKMMFSAAAAVDPAEFSFGDGPIAAKPEFLVGAQSPAPDHPAHHHHRNSSNGGLSVVAGSEKIASKRKKSAKRMR